MLWFTCLFPTKKHFCLVGCLKTFYLGIVSLGSSGWPDFSYVEQANLELAI